jgi:hypothetical protein
MRSAIISKLVGYEEYPFEAIDSVSLRHLADALGGKLNNGMLTLFECYLEVTGESITRSSFASKRFSTITLGFLGALNSGRLIECGILYRYILTRRWIRAVNELAANFPAIELPPTESSTVGPGPILSSWAQKFEAQDLSSEKAWLWKGWSSINRSGIHTRMPLYSIYRRLGRAFTQKLFTELDSWYRARKSTRVPCLRSLATFIGQYPKNITPSDFQDRNFVSEFWTEFRAFYVRSSFGGGKGSQLTTITIKWQTQFIPLLQEHLAPSGLFAEPWGALPMLEVKRVHGSKAKLKQTPQGQEVKTKTLTHIPVHVTDEDAYDLLFKKIREEYETVENMANRLCEDIWRRYEYRITAAKTGTPRFVNAVGINSGDNKWMTDRENPEHLKNACATFAQHGYSTSIEDSLTVLYPLPLSLTAAELALPTVEALYPHCLLLVIEHPKITTTFLEELELYDKNEKRFCFVQDGTKYRLIGHKCRRGAILAQQVVHLSDKAARLVQQIISITEPVRLYLRAHGDDNWRFLLLSCGKGFAYPCRWRNISAGKWVRVRRERLVTALGVTSNLSEPERQDLVSRLTLSSLRASAGLLVYLETRSVEKMSRALGHAEYKPGLLAHYLPKTISDFFQERWIRIFQTGIIVEALKESPALMVAADFSNLAELHEFLAHHALKVPPDSAADMLDLCDNKGVSNKKHRVLFGISTPILAALLSLELSVREHKDSNAKAIYWAGVANALVSHIEANRRDRPDLAAKLQLAKSQARPYSESFTRGL